MQLGLVERMDKFGLNYIRKEKGYLIFTALFPVILIMINLLTLIFLSTWRHMNQSNPSNYSYNMITPGIFSSIVFIFAVINVIYLSQWKQKVDLLALRIQTDQTAQKEREGNVPADLHLADGDLNTPGSSVPDQGDVPVAKKVSLTRLFYNIVHDMEVLRKIFIVLNLVCVYAFYWFVRFFFFSSQPINVDQNQFPYLRVLNISSQVLTIIYLLVQWKNFLKWNKKLRALKELEQKIYTELSLGLE
jgi:hypothetical protein